jgi:predicted outer membrane repeat protein
MSAPSWPTWVLPRRSRRGRRSTGVRPDLLRLEGRVLPATFVVNSLTDGVDANPGDGTALTADGRITLRSAVQESNALGGSNTIVLGFGTYILSIPGPNEDNAATGDLDILAPITIQGANTAGTVIRGDGTDRIFDVRTAGAVSIANLTVIGGRADVGGGLRLAGAADLTLDGVSFNDNIASADGGAVAAVGPASTVTIANALYSNNIAGGSGGAIDAVGHTFDVHNVTFATNSAAAGGGAVAAAGGSWRVDNATFDRNQTGGGGGGIRAGTGTAFQLFDSTLTANAAGLGGAAATGGATFRVQNTILAGNSGGAAPDVSGAVTSLGHNLVGVGAGSTGFSAAGDQVGTAAAPIDPKLAELNFYGGAAPTRVPLPGSPAIDAGAAVAGTDQRGVSRPQGAADDIGAVEAKAFTLAAVSKPQSTRVGTAFPAPLSVKLTEGNTPLANVPITFTAPAAGASASFVVETGPQTTITVLTDSFGVATVPAPTANTVAGTYSVRASVAPGMFIDLPLTNTPAPLAQLTLDGAPPSDFAGQPLTLTVSARDAFGNVVPGYTGTVHFASDDPLASLPNDLVFTAADQGRQTASVTLRSGGLRHVRINDVALTTLTDTASVNVVLVAHFDVQVPPGVTEGRPFAVTVTARDVFGNVAGTFAGPVTFASDDPLASLPTGASFAPADKGVATFTGFVFRTPGPHTLTVTDASSAAQGGGGGKGSATVSVAGLGPRNLALTTSAATLDEGQTLTLDGHFADPDVRAAHTAVIRWGDGTPDTVIALNPGVLTFHAAHPYADNPPGQPVGSFPITVTVSNAAAQAISASASVTVKNVAPVIAPPPAATVTNREGTPFAFDGSFTDPGADTWTATADYGDGTGPQRVAVTPDRHFHLDHVYTSEGTFTVLMTLDDGDGGHDTFRERVAVLLPGAGLPQIVVVPPGQTLTASVPGLTVTLFNASPTTPATLIVATVALNALTGLAGDPAADPNQDVLAFDIRVLDADPNDLLTAKFDFSAIGAPGRAAFLQYFNAAAGTFQTVLGSTSQPDGLVTDTAGLTVTVKLDSTSNPKVTDLGRTIFTLSVPDPATTGTGTGTGQQPPFQLVTLSNGPGGLAGDTTTRLPAATTGLVSSSGLTLTLSASEGLRRDGGGDQPTGLFVVNPQVLAGILRTVFDVRDYLTEAYRMWLDQPPPMAAPAVPVPPEPDALEVHVRAAELTPAPAAVAPFEVVTYEPIALDPPGAAALAAAPGPAEEQPWWRTVAVRAATEKVGDEPIPLPAAGPREEDQSAALLTGLWLGGVALHVSAPDLSADDEDRPRRPHYEWPEESGDETDR